MKKQSFSFLSCRVIIGALALELLASSSVLARAPAGSSSDQLYQRIQNYYCLFILEGEPTAGSNPAPKASTRPAAGESTASANGAAAKKMPPSTVPSPDEAADSAVQRANAIRKKQLSQLKGLTIEDCKANLGSSHLVKEEESISLANEISHLSIADYNAVLIHLQKDYRDAAALGYPPNPALLWQSIDTLTTRLQKNVAKELIAQDYASTDPKKDAAIKFLSAFSWTAGALSMTGFGVHMAKSPVGKKATAWGLESTRLNKVSQALGGYLNRNGSCKDGYAALADKHVPSAESGAATGPVDLSAYSRSGEANAEVLAQLEKTLVAKPGSRLGRMRALISPNLQNLLTHKKIVMASLGAGAYSEIRSYLKDNRLDPRQMIHEVQGQIAYQDVWDFVAAEQVLLEKFRIDYEGRTFADNQEKLNYLESNLGDLQKVNEQVIGLIDQGTYLKSSYSDFISIHKTADSAKAGELNYIPNEMIEDAKNLSLSVGMLIDRLKDDRSQLKAQTPTTNPSGAEPASPTSRPTGANGAAADDNGGTPPPPSGRE